MRAYSKIVSIVDLQPHNNKTFQWGGVLDLVLDPFLCLDAPNIGLSPLCIRLIAHVLYKALGLGTQTSSLYMMT